jgi:hypothetical protein
MLRFFPVQNLDSVKNQDFGVHELRIEIHDSKIVSYSKDIQAFSRRRDLPCHLFRFFILGFEVVDYTFKFTFDNGSTEKEHKCQP